MTYDKMRYANVYRARSETDLTVSELSLPHEKQVVRKCWRKAASHVVPLLKTE